ncbi:MAG TPA: hypothetical protein VFJ43_00530 [Bacteroidia bacterium]|nr:hypothetical protein [Bacteroidia bacterium]
METITSDIEIFRFLEKADSLAFDPLKNAVFEFSHENYWCLLIFSSSGPTKGCKLFLLEHHHIPIEAEKELLPELLSLREDYGYDLLKNEALLIVEKLISRKNNSHLFFDAH